MIRLLLALRDPLSAAELAALLGREHFDVHVAHTAADALGDIEANVTDLVVLDLGLPDMPGPRLCGAVRDRTTAGIIVVTARTDEDDIVATLDHGADDYLTKPHGAAELIARVRAVLRRCSPEASGVITAGPVALNPGGHTATVTGRPIDLARKEFQLLETFVRNPGRTLGRDQLLAAVWDGARADSNTLNVHVKRLRAKIEVDPRAPRHLVTVRGIGYKFRP
jgi:two-component system response regulator RegX3